jgi:transposase
VTPRRDPVAMMLDIADRFMSQAPELDQRVAAAVDADASATDIAMLMNLAATDRLRALTACQAAAPFVSPKLTAIEVTPASMETRSRFDERLAGMSEPRGGRRALRARCLFEHL